MKPSERILRNAFGKDFHVIQEAKVSQDCIDKFGEELFGNFLGGKEADTEYEDYVFKRVEDFVDGGGNQSQAKKAFMDLKDCMKDYPDILEPPSRTLFRGTKIRELPNNLNLSKFDDMRKILKLPHKDHHVVFKNYTYKPRGEIQSWTTSRKIADEFVGEHHGYGGVLYASFPKSELLFNTSFMNKISIKKLGSSEYEVVRISKKPVKCILYLPYDTISNHLPMNIFTFARKVKAGKNYVSLSPSGYGLAKQDVLKIFKYNGYSGKALEEVEEFLNQKETNYPSDKFLKDMNTLQDFSNLR